MKYLLWNTGLAGWHRDALDGIRHITSRLDLAGRFEVKEAVAFQAAHPGTVVFPDVEGEVAAMSPEELQRVLNPGVASPADVRVHPGTQLHGVVSASQFQEVLNTCAEMRHSLRDEGWTEEMLTKAFGDVGKVVGEVADVPQG
jgi:Leu/Phe-tRNA-protein transferase